MRLEVAAEILGGEHGYHGKLGPGYWLPVRVEDAAANGHVLDQAEGQFALRSGLANRGPIAAVPLGHCDGLARRCVP